MKVSEFDTSALALLRANVESFLARCSESYSRPGAVLLDIAPQDHRGAAPHFPDCAIHTLDINPASNATYIADICDPNIRIPSNSFDFICCTEVLEHTLQPFLATDNLNRLLKPGGLAFVTTPFNFRIHGPLPDCWRFTEHGLKVLFKSFEIIELSALESDRFLMPIQYSLVARKVR